MVFSGDNIAMPSLNVKAIKQVKIQGYSMPCFLLKLALTLSHI